MGYYSRAGLSYLASFLTNNFPSNECEKASGMILNQLNFLLENGSICRKKQVKKDTEECKKRQLNTASFMGKVSPKRPMSFKQKKQSRNIKNMYLRPGALAQLCYSRTTIKSCADISKKRVWMLDTDNFKDNLSLTITVANHSPSVLSSKIMRSRPVVDPMDIVKPENFPGTPRTPLIANWEFDSGIESLPMDILVKILCHLHHDQLKAVILVSKRITNAVLLAKEWHFNYTTPDRSRQEMLRAKKILLNEHGPSGSNGDGKGMWASVPSTPKAPKQGRRCLTSHIITKEMQQIAADLFHESAFPSRCTMPPHLPKPTCKSLAPSRVLFY